MQLGHVVLGQGDLYALGGGIVSVAGEAALGDLRPIQNAQHVVQHGRVVAVELLELLAQIVALQLGGRGDGGIGQRHPLQLAHHTGLAEKMGDHGLDLVQRLLSHALLGGSQLGQHLTDVLCGGINGLVAQNGAVQIQTVAGHAGGGAEYVLAGQVQRQHSAVFALQKAQGQCIAQILHRGHGGHVVAGDQLNAVFRSGQRTQGQHGAQKQRQKNRQQFGLFHRCFSPFNGRQGRFNSTILITIIHHTTSGRVCHVFCTENRKIPCKTFRGKTEPSAESPARLKNRANSG